MKIFAERLRELRKEQKKTQTQMADYLQCSLRAYQYYESAEHYPEIPDLIRLADFFGVSIDYLLGHSEKR